MTVDFEALQGELVDLDIWTYAAPNGDLVFLPRPGEEVPRATLGRIVAHEAAIRADAARCSFENRDGRRCAAPAGGLDITGAPLCYGHAYRAWEPCRCSSCLIDEREDTRRRWDILALGLGYAYPAGWVAVDNASGEWSFVNAGEASWRCFATKLSAEALAHAQAWLRDGPPLAGVPDQEPPVSAASAVYYRAEAHRRQADVQRAAS